MTCEHTLSWYVLDMARPDVRRDERSLSFNCTCKCVAVKPRRTSRGTGNRQAPAPRDPAPRLSSATRTAPEARCQQGVGLIYPLYDATLLDARASR